MHNDNLEFLVFENMNNKQIDNKIIFGLKVRQLRIENSLSFADLSKKSGLSISYLNEIEKGKKFPKSDKILLLANALNTTEEELCNLELKRNLAPIGELLNSNFLNELPLELFGIELIKVIEIIADAPARVGAFIAALVGIARNYALSADNFYFAAMRAYQELHYNYFEDIEQAVDEFIIENKINKNSPVSVRNLQEILTKQYHYKITENGLSNYKELAHLRSVWVSKSNTLLLQSGLSDSQKAFQLGKEIGFSYLNLQERSKTATLSNPSSFDVVLNNFKANYFSVALLVNRDSAKEKLNSFFKNTTWNGKALLQIIDYYGVSAEIFFQRGNILPKFFGLDKLFFFRMVHNTLTDKLFMDKELHLNRHHYPHSNGLDETYCKRWVSSKIFENLEQHQRENDFNGNVVAIQRSIYHQSGDEYLCISVARKGHITMPNRNVSVTIGIKIEEKMKKIIRFADDPSIPSQIVNITCERCPIENCRERAATPSWIDERNNRKKIKSILDDIENMV